MQLSLAPLQGITEFPFRNTMHELIGGPDKYYTPFLRMENDGTLKNKFLKDIHPDNNLNIPVIPQILVNNAPDFLFFAKIIEDFGYTELNWNLGCPFPMVAKRKLGSGLIQYPELAKQILEEVMPLTKLKIGIKIRAGYETHHEILAVLKALELLLVNEIVLHPRVGKDMYKGEAKLDAFVEAQQSTHYKLGYNGDITSVASFNALKAKLPETSHFMIGRALIGNPFLAADIKNNGELDFRSRRTQFENFHERLMAHYSSALSGDSHLHTKMIHFWEYFAQLFENSHKAYKLVKKSKNVTDFNNVVAFITRNEPLVNENHKE
jgi:tRNA-dihydrouridine synthase